MADCIPRRLSLIDPFKVTTKSTKSFLYERTFVSFAVILYTRETLTSIVSGFSRTVIRVC